MGISRFTIGKISVLRIKCLYLSSEGFTATAVSPSIVSGLVVAMVKCPCPSFKGYLKCQRFEFSSLCSTSSSESTVLHRGHQFTMYFPLYINPFSYKATKTFRTALFKPSSRVKRSLDQSTEQPMERI